MNMNKKRALIILAAIIIYLVVASVGGVVFACSYSPNNWGNYFLGAFVTYGQVLAICVLYLIFFIHGAITMWRKYR